MSRGYPGPSGSGLGELSTLECLYCHASLHFVGVPATRYEEHLFKEHNILYDADAVVERTLRLQRPQLWQNLMRAKKNVADVEIQVTPESAKTPILIRIKEDPQKSATVPTIASPPPPPQVAATQVWSTPPKPSLSDLNPNFNDLPFESGPAQPDPPPVPKPSVTDPGPSLIDLSADSPPTAANQVQDSKPETTEKLVKPLRIVVPRKRIGPLRFQGLNRFEGQKALLEVSPFSDTSNEPVKQKLAGPLRYQGPPVAPESPPLPKSPDESEPSNTVLQPLKSPEPSTSTSSDDPELIVKLPWYAGCEYRCKICSVLYFYNQDLRGHVKRHHGCPDDYLDKFDTFETKVVYFKCRNCKETIKRHFTSIRNHLMKHEISMEDYQVMFSIPLKYDVTISGKLGEEQEVVIKKGSKRNASGEKKDAKRRRSGSPFVDIQPRSKKWFDGQNLDCMVQDCGKVFFEPQVLFAHLKQIHDLEPLTYAQAYSFSSPSVEWYLCRICNVKVKLQKSTIENHLNTNHQMDLDEYENAYINPNTLKEPIVATSSSDVDHPAKSDSDSSKSDYETWSKGDCRFVCCVCAFETGDSRTFWKHASSQHQLGINEYKAEYSDPCIEGSKFECKSCFKVIRQDPGSMENHFLRAHDLTLENYFEKFVATKSKKQKPVPKSCKPGPKSHKIAKGNKTLSEIRKMMGKNHYGPKSTSDPQQSLFLKWKNACIYECQICCKYSSRWPGDLKSHVKNKHSISINDYTKIFSEYKSEVVFHQCKICKEEILQTSQDLIPHMASHRITLEFYYKLHVINDSEPIQSDIAVENGQPEFFDEAFFIQNLPKLSKFVCKICSFGCSSYSWFTNHLKTFHNIDAATYAAQNGKIQSSGLDEHLCKICGIVFQMAIIKLHISSHNTSLQEYYSRYFEKKKLTKTPNLPPPSGFNEWANCPLYKCPICPRVTMELNELYLHAKSIHNLHPGELETKYPKASLVLENAKHICLLCNLRVTKTVPDLEKHMKSLHKTTAESYYKAKIMPIVIKFNEWKDACTFRCQKCTFTTKFKSEGLDHLVKAHNHVWAIGDLFSDQLLLEEIHIVCKICNTTVLQESGALGIHMLQHETDLMDYYLTMFVNTAAVASSNNSTSNVANRDWINKCLICCKACNLTSVSLVKHWFHVMNFHGMTQQDYEFRYGHPMIQQSFYTCKICNMGIPCEEQFVSEHMSQVHNLPLDEYYNTFVMKQPVKAKSSAPVTTKESSNKGRGLLRFRWNQCRHTCGICQQLFAAENTLNAHVKSKHGLTWKTYNETNTTYVEDISCVCLICKEAVTFTQKAMDEHLKKNHQTSLSAYELAHFDEINNQFFNLDAARKSGLITKEVQPLTTTEPELDQFLADEIDAFIAGQDSSQAFVAGQSSSQEFIAGQDTFQMPQLASDNIKKETS